MDVEVMDVAGRVAVHRALGDPHRLAITDALRLSDRTPGELRAATGLDWNLLRFHLRRLEDGGVVERRVSEGDHRRRYVRLRPGVIEQLVASGQPLAADDVLFVCTHNSARSPFAAALWHRRTGRRGCSAGSVPAETVQPLAVEVAAGYGLDLAGARPRAYEAVTEAPDLVVSVCDRAFEGGVPFHAARLHWSVPDPVPGDRGSFEAAFANIAERLDRLAGTVAA